MTFKNILNVKNNDKNRMLLCLIVLKLLTKIEYSKDDIEAKINFITFIQNIINLICYN